MASHCDTRKAKEVHRINHNLIYISFGSYTMHYRVLQNIQQSALNYKARHVARMGEERGVYRVLVGKPEGKRPMGRPRRRWEDNIRMHD
jgi:hypothetical protein